MSATEAETAAVDARLVEVVAAALCWAEWTRQGHKRRTDDPLSYWTGIADHAKDGYRKSAVLLALFMCGDADLAVVPNEPTAAMLNAARHCVRASEPNIRQAWSLMLTEAWLSLGKVVRGAD